MAGTGVGKFSSTAGNNTANMTVNFAENMAPSNVNNAARELMGHMRDMYEQLGDGYFEFGDGDGTYTVARSDADTITITSSSDISSVYFAGRKIRITDGGANVVEGTIASSSHSSTTQTVNLTGISLASGTPTKVELGIDTAAFGGRVILDDDGDTYIEAPTDDTIDIYVAGAKDFVITANTFTAESGSTIAAQALTATGIDVTGAITATAASTITTADNTDTLSLVSTDADANSGPNLRLYRNSSSPVNDDVTGVIQFEGRNNNSQDFISSEIKSVTSDVADGSEDGALGFSVMNAGTLQNVLFLTGPEVVFNETSNDIDFRVESNSHTHMLFVDGGNNRVGVKLTPDLGDGLHIKTADSGASSNANFDELVIEGSSASGLCILTPNNQTGGIAFGDDGDNDRGRIAYDHSNDRFFIDTNGNDAPAMFFHSSNAISTSGETAPDVGEGGITLDQNASDSQILSFKSSDIAHGMTAHKETDTFAAFEKHNATEGGVRLVGLSESGSPGIMLEAFITSATNTEAVGSEAAVMVNTALKNGKTIQDFGADDNLFAVRMNSDTRFIVKGDGELFSDQSATVGTYDAYEDAQLVRAYDLNHMQGVINSKFDKFVQYNKDDLQKAKLIGTDNQGNVTPMVNITGMQRLHNGAIWQQYEKTERLANAVYELAKAAVGEEKANEILEQNEIKLLN